MDAHNLSLLLLYHPSNHLPAGVLRNCGAGCIFGCLLLLGYIRFESPTWLSGMALLLVGMILSFAAWAAFRLWTVTIAPMVVASPDILKALTRVPFWAMAGAIGYTAAILLMKKLSWLAVADRPVRPHFYFGGAFVGGLQMLFEAVVIAVGRRTR